MPAPNMEVVVSLAKRRGFVFGSSEIYGGMGGFWDYGPLGVELKNNIKNAWWRQMVQLRDDIVGLDAAIIMNPRVWEVSGHVAGFSDPMVDCRSCKLRFRADDLKAHTAGSGKGLSIFDEASGEHVTPFVIEPAMGVDRAVLTALLDGYAEEEVAGEKRVVLHLRPSLAPVKVAVMPLLRNRSDLVERARALAGDLKQRMAATYDDTASIGKLYRRQDEIGTPFCVTVDVDSLTDGAATIRERDSMTQERVALSALPNRLAALLAGDAPWEGKRREPPPAED